MGRGRKGERVAPCACVSGERENSLHLSSWTQTLTPGQAAAMLCLLPHFWVWVCVGVCVCVCVSVCVHVWVFDGCEERFGVVHVCVHMFECAYVCVCV